MTDSTTVFQKLEFSKIQQRLVHYTTSELGRSLADHVTPDTSSSTITLALTKVTELKRILESDDPFPVEGIRDIRSALQRASIEGSALPPPDLFSILSTQRTARALRTYFQRRATAYPLLSEAAVSLFIDKVLEYNIDQAIDEEGHVKDNASKNLHEIRRGMVAKSASLRKKLETILKNVALEGFVQEEIITTREGRMVLPVKVEYKGQVPGFIHSASASGATVFIEPAETLEMNNEIRNLQFEEQREIERILRKLTDQIREVKDALLLNCAVLGEIDFIYAKAMYSIEIIGSQPIIYSEGPLRLYDARHPVLLQRHRRDDVIPLSLTLGDAYRTLIITGPNAGGKSVAMKTVGLLALMVQSGLHIPASSHSEFPVFNSVFVDIGDEQSVENDLSTFSSHLRNLNQIVSQADNTSLVLIDEIGAGTDPTEGGALAAAILQDLTQKGAFTIATTHHGALKAFAHETPRVSNGAMEFDQSTLQPTYRFKAGIPGSSYALEIARRLGIPDNIITNARTLIGTQKDRLENLLADLELRSQQLQSEIKAIQKAQEELKQSKDEYELKNRTFKKELKEIRKQAVDQAEEITRHINTTIERVVREIRESDASKEILAKTKKEIAQIQNDVKQLRKELAPEEGGMIPEEIHHGDHVRLHTGSDIGEVVEVINNNHEAIVAFGSLKMRCEIAHLRKVQSPKPASQYVNTTSFQGSEEFRREIDLRGMLGDEAIAAVDKFLDEAFVAGLRRVDIIHGKGTGALRKKINEFLKTHPHVKSQRLGEWNEGSTGVTVVELRD
ncbi:MAG: endonuclease MutS2 [Bacteroidota bacterium]